MEPKKDVIRPKIGVGVLISNDNNEYLLIKRKNVHGNGTWAPPGGHLELGESVIECAKREALEETNAQTCNERVLTITEDIFDEHTHYITIWVSAEFCESTIINKEPEKCEAIEWHSAETFPEPLFLSFSNLLKQAE